MTHEEFLEHAELEYGELSSRQRKMCSEAYLAGRASAYTASPSKAVAVAKSKKADIDAAFDVFWQSGIRKMDKKVKARPAFTRAIPKGCPPMEFAEMLCRDVAERLRIEQGGFAEMHPSTYLNGERWEDEVRAPAGFAPVQNTGMLAFGKESVRDCFEGEAAAADDTLAFMRGITDNAKKTSSEVQGQLTLEH